MIRAGGITIGNISTKIITAVIPVAVEPMLEKRLAVMSCPCLTSAFAYTKRNNIM